MAEERILTRQELYELVWSKPMQQLAKDFKVSDVGLAKGVQAVCHPAAGARVLGAGLAAGTAPTKPKLPTAPAGVAE